MPFLDRTSEIQSIIQNQQQKKQYEQSGNGKKNSKKKQDKDVNSAQFNDKARQVSKELQETADLLQKLTKLVKKKTPFDDNSELIKNLTLKVKEQLSNQDYSLRSLQDVIDKKQEKEKKNQQTQHSSHIITGLNSKLLYATEQFQNVLKTRTTQMKSDKKRRNMYTFESGVKSLSSLTVNQTAASPNARVQLGQNMNAAGSSDDSSIGNEKIDELISEGSQLQQMNTSSVNRNLLASRTDDILSIEREVEKLGGMFNHLAVMIKHHGELTQRIDQNLNMAADDLEKGETELIKVWENTKGNTGLILKIFAVLVVFIIIVGLLVVR